MRLELLVLETVEFVVDMRVPQMEWKKISDAVAERLELRGKGGGERGRR